MDIVIDYIISQTGYTGNLLLDNHEYIYPINPNVMDIPILNTIYSNIKRNLKKENNDNGVIIFNVVANIVTITWVVENKLENEEIERIKQQMREQVTSEEMKEIIKSIIKYNSEKRLLLIIYDDPLKQNLPISFKNLNISLLDDELRMDIENYEKERLTYIDSVFHFLPNIIFQTNQGNIMFYKNSEDKIFYQYNNNIYESDKQTIDDYFRNLTPLITNNLEPLVGNNLARTIGAANSQMDQDPTLSYYLSKGSIVSNPGQNRYILSRLKDQNGGFDTNLVEYIKNRNKINKPETYQDPENKVLKSIITSPFYNTNQLVEGKPLWVWILKYSNNTNLMQYVLNTVKNIDNIDKNEILQYASTKSDRVIYDRINKHLQ